MTRILFLVNILLIAGTAFGAKYHRTENIQGAGFLQSFFHQAIPDPTMGRVNYVDAATAQRQNLTFASGDHFVLRSDFKKTLTPGGLGRDSVRLMSNNQYSTSVIVFNVRHMPQGCGTWPALWTVGYDWPNQGEIDILEGVNDQTPNQATLHTGNGDCTMAPFRPQTGMAKDNNCDSQQTNNLGCSVKLSDQRSYGPQFNANGGGWYAMERTPSFIKIWFWPRSASNVPMDVRNGASSVNTNRWGTPSAYFPDTSCAIRSKFGPHHIIINLTFCGVWAGDSSVYAASGCPSTCEDYVNNNPSAFANAYFDFQWLNIYE